MKRIGGLLMAVVVAVSACTSSLATPTPPPGSPTVDEPAGTSGSIAPTPTPSPAPGQTPVEDGVSAAATPSPVPTPAPSPVATPTLGTTSPTPTPLPVPAATILPSGDGPSGDGTEGGVLDTRSSSISSVDLGRFRQLLPRDAIRPVYDPVFVPAESATYLDSELVMGVTVNGESKAYSVGFLSFREMVNDELGGIPILVTW